jgi:C1A family cysteine protease
VFKETLKTIEEQNAAPGDHAEYGVTMFADRTNNEMRRKCGGPKTQQPEAPTEFQVGTNHSWDGTCYSGVRQELSHLCNGTLPDSFDWSIMGAVTKIKDQGKCGNCFTYGATGDYESAWYLSGHPMISLSEQQITSCDRVGGDAGCAGGDTNLDTDRYVVENGGIASEADYPDCSSTYSCKATAEEEDAVDDDTGKVVRKNGVCHKNLEKKIAATMTGGYQVSGGVKVSGLGKEKRDLDPKRLRYYSTIVDPTYAYRTLCLL